MIHTNFLKYAIYFYKSIYIKEVKAFAYYLYYSFELCYRILYDYLPFQFLFKEKFEEKFNELGIYLFSIDNAVKILRKQSKSKKKIYKITLVINTFIASLIKPYSKKNKK